MSQPQTRMDLLQTKLQPPPVCGKRVRRMRLLRKLDAAASQKITLVCSPAGYGKTTLLSQWASRRLEPVGWVSLDRGDNDLAQFLRYFIAAIQRINPAVGVHIPEMMQPPQPLLYPAVWTPLINEVAASGRAFIIILDDYQEVEAQPVHEALEYLIEHMPENLHLILASRADPPLLLPRLRVRGNLAELRQDDLLFTTEEATAFLNDVMGLGLSAKDVAALEARTEGWIAALQMAALSLQGGSPSPAARSEFIQAFTGSHRFVLDYLLDEVLERQPPDLQGFLLRTSILEHLSAPLCDAILGGGETIELVERRTVEVAGSTGSQSTLEGLERANLFIVPLDDERRWYRYHRLFCDLLRKRLWQTDPDLAPVLHRRASVWHERQGLMPAAIDHALAAQDFERAASLLEDHVQTAFMRSEVTTFLNWMKALPEEWVRNRPNLCYFDALALLMSGASPHVVERRLQELAFAQVTFEDDRQNAGRTAVLRAYYLVFQADVLRAAALCRQALEQLPESDLFLRSVASWILSLIRLSDGELQDGVQALEEVIRMSQEIGNPLIAVAGLSHQARLQMRQGQLGWARETLQRALQLATDAQGRRLPIASEALIVLGELEREWNNLETAADDLTESIELSRRWSELSALDAYFPLMRVRLAQGDVEAAREALETAQQMAYSSEISKVDDVIADLQQAYFYAARGDFSAAMRWAEKRGLTPSVPPWRQPALDERQEYIDAHLRKYEQLVLARLFILQGRAAEALELLDDLLAQARGLRRTDLIIEVQVLRALAHQQEGHAAQALEALAEALSLAEPGGYVRIFLDEGKPMARLLRMAASRGLAPAYVSKLLAAFGGTPSAEMGAQPASSRLRPLVEPLSERELDVLRLLAAGMSNPQIADELVVAVSTVHTHCKSIYGKLNVHRRWDAVQRARELGLI